MKKKLFILLMTVMVVSMAIAQSETDLDGFIIQGKKMIDQAVTQWELPQLMAARSYFERLLSQDEREWLIRYYIGYVDNRLSSYFGFTHENKEQAKKYVNDGIEQLEKALELKADFAEGYALMASLLGGKMGISPMSAITLGPKSGMMIQKGFKLGPGNPRVSLIAGENALYTPKMFGGGADKALVHIVKSLDLFEKVEPEESIMPDWGYDEAYAYLGMVHEKLKNYEKAKEGYDKALELNPEYAWVKHFLIPNLEKKMGTGDVDENKKTTEDSN